MTNDKSILFIGYGKIGQYELQRLKSLERIYIYDPACGEEVDGYPNVVDWYQNNRFDFAIVSVPTPNTKEGLCDTRVVEMAIRDCNAEIFIIKSTVAPGTTKALAEKYPNKRIIFSPEHFGTTQHAKNFEYDFTILGGAKEDCLKVQQLLQKVYDARHRFIITDSTTAELSKYMLNSYLAMKVNFCNAFWEICSQYGVNYEELRECFVQDPRINPAHTFVYDDAPFWDSHCFNKDLPAIANATDNQLLIDIVKYNEYLKHKYKK